MGNSLDNQSLEQLGHIFPIYISEPNPEWNKIYNEERELLYSEFIDNQIVSIEHIGSTAIPGLKAKPTIDILLEIEKDTSNDEIIRIFESLNYHYISQPENPAPHMMFVKGYTEKGFKGQAFHVHVRYPGDWDEIYFRDYLRENEKAKKEYENLKLHLAKIHKYNRENYTEGKTEFIKKINKLGRRNFK